LLNQDIFPLNLDERLCTLFENTYNYEVQFSSLFESKYGYSILPNFREGIIMADYIYKEVNNLLHAKAKA